MSEPSPTMVWFVRGPRLSMTSRSRYGSAVRGRTGTKGSSGGRRGRTEATGATRENGREEPGSADGRSGARRVDQAGSELLLPPNDRGSGSASEGSRAEPPGRRSARNRP